MALRCDRNGTGIRNACVAIAVTVAVPICQHRISPVLDSAARLLVVTRRRGREVSRRDFVLDPQSPEILASSIAELSVDVLLCAAVSEPLLRALERRGVRIRSHLCGEVEEILEAFCQRRLGGNDFLMPGCWQRAHRFAPASKPRSQRKP